MKSKSLLLFLNLITVLVFSQNNVTITATKSSMGENESIDVLASIEKPTDKDIIINFNYSGTAVKDKDFFFNFPTKGFISIAAGGNGYGSAPNQFKGSTGVVVDKEGNVYVSDYDNHRVQKWAPGATEGITVAGGNGWGTAPNQLCSPRGMFIDASNNLYIANECANNVIKWSPGASEGVIVAGGNGAGNLPNQLSNPTAVCVDRSGNIFVADIGNERIQKWAPGATVGVTVAGGNGRGSANNQFNSPVDVFVDANGSLFVADMQNYRIQKFLQGSTEGITVAGGNGWGSNANQLLSPYALHVDNEGNIFIADRHNKRIQKWILNASTGITIAEGDLGGLIPDNFFPYDLSMDETGNIYSADADHGIVMKFQYAPQIIIKAGQTRGTLTITGNNDETIEDEETIILTPGKVINGILVNTGEIPVSISDMKMISFTFSAPRIVENSTDDVVLTATVNEISSKDIEISFITEGTALETIEYLSSSKKIIIPAGSKTGALTISTKGLDDSESEILESIIFKVISITNASSLSDTALLLLESDDYPSVTIGSTTSTFTESGSLDILATLSGKSHKDVYIDLDLTGVAKLEADYNTQFTSKGNPSTVAGGNGSGSNSDQILPKGVHVDNHGNVYIADELNHRVQKWIPGASSATTVAGGNGSGSNANQLSTPSAVFVDESGNLYVSDAGNNRVQLWTPGTTEGVTIAGGNGAGSGNNQLSNPQGIHVDLAGNLYVSDKNNHRIQQFAPNTLTGVTVAGGKGSGSWDNQLNYPCDIHVDASGLMFIADWNNNRILKWRIGNLSSEGGIGTYYRPNSVSVDKLGNIYASVNNTITRWPSNHNSFEDKSIVVAGTKVAGSAANQLKNPADFFIDKGGNIYIADADNYRVQKYQYAPQILIKAGESTGKLTLVGVNDNIDKDDKTIVVTPINADNAVFDNLAPRTVILADDEEAPTVTFTVSSEKLVETWYQQITLKATLSAVSGKDIKIDFITEGTAKEIADYTVNSKTITIPAGKSYGTITISSAQDDNIVEPLESIIFKVATIINSTTEGNIPVVWIESDDLPSVKIESSLISIAEHEGFDIIASIESATSKDVIIDLELTGTALYEHDYTAEFPTKGTISTFGGNGQGYESHQLSLPTGVFVDSKDYVFVADSYNFRVQKWTPDNMFATTVAGSGDNGIALDRLAHPTGVFVDEIGNVYVSDLGNQRVVKWVPGAYYGVIVAGGNSPGSNQDQLSNPGGIFVDEAGNVYIADDANNRIQKWAPGAKTGVTVAGGNGMGSNANQLHSPTDVVVDKTGAIYISDVGNNRIQKWLPGAISGITVAGKEYGSNLNQFHNPTGLAIDEGGNLFVADQMNHRVLKFRPGVSEGIIVAGGAFGTNADQLNNPYDVCLDRGGNVYVVDTYNHRVQKYLYAPQIVIKAGETTGKVSFTAIHDSYNSEGDETILVKAKSVIYAADSTRALSITIHDNNTSLTLKENPFIGLTNDALAWGDFDRDGDQDVAVMGQSAIDGTVTAIIENRDGSFVNTNQDLVKLHHGDISWVDLDKDGWLDLVISGYNDAPYTKVYLNMEGKGFTPSADNFGLPQLYESRMAWGDLDNDGDIDLAISGINASDEFVCQAYYMDDNLGKFTLDELMQRKEVGWYSLINGDLKIMDVDMDGDNDVVYSGEFSNRAPLGGIIFNSYFDHPEKFFLIENFNLTNSTIEAARLSSNNEYITILASGVDELGNIQLATNNYNLGFVALDGSVIEAPKLKNGDIAIADYNCDGLNDIIFTGEDKLGSAITKLFFQEETGKFKEADIQLLGLRNSTADWIDYDLDGDLDLFLTGEDENGAKVILYENETANMVNMPPSIISGLKTEHLGNGKVRFSWDKPSDDLSSNLGYFLRIGTTPGGSELSNIESDLLTGKRLISRHANIYNNYYETQLDPGIYYWSVQAVDPGLEGGMFSQENTLALTYDWKVLNQGGIVDRRVRAVKDPVMKLGDIDNDNDMDLIYGSAYDGNVGLLKFDGSRLSASIDSPFNNVSRSTDIEVGDINGDGTSDVLINNAEYDGSYGLLLYMSSNSGFVKSTIGAGLYKAKARIIDFNNDGKVEVALLGLSNDLVSGKLKMIIHEYNIATGTFITSDISNQLTSVTSSSFDLGDIDNDQDIDIILNGYSSSNGYQCNLYTNTTQPGGSHTFTKTPNSLVAVVNGTSDLIDVDGDGDLDVVISGTGQAGDVFSVYQNNITNGIASFVKLDQSGLLAMREGKVDMGDFNGDGYYDLLYSGTFSGLGKNTGLSEYDPTSKMYRNSAFNVSEIIADQVEFGDFEGDGDLDFVISGESKNYQGMNIFRAYINVRNESASVLAKDASRSVADYTVNESPAMPSQPDVKVLNALPDGKVVVEFSWLPSSDDHTPEKGLTYALKVGKTSTGDEIMSPNANLNGIRKTAKKGNVEHNLKWRLALAKGTYYWSVQAIDASFAGSSFTPTQKIVINTLGIDDPDLDKHLMSYPNPTTGLFNIVIPDNDREVRVTIRNTTGSIMSESTMQVPSDRKLNMNISDLKAGVYFITIQTENENYIVKLVKK